MAFKNICNSMFSVYAHGIKIHQFVSLSFSGFNLICKKFTILKSFVTVLRFGSSLKLRCTESAA